MISLFTHSPFESILHTVVRVIILKHCLIFNLQLKCDTSQTSFHIPLPPHHYPTTLSTHSLPQSQQVSFCSRILQSSGFLFVLMKLLSMLVFTWHAHFRFSCLGSVTTSTEKLESQTRNIQPLMATFQSTVLLIACTALRYPFSKGRNCVVQQNTTSNYNTWHPFIK